MPDMPRALIALLLAGLAAPLAGQTKDAANAAGKWNLTVTTAQGETPATLVLKKDGETLTGTVNGPQGEFAVKGTQKAAAVTLSMTVQRDQGPLLVTLSGTQDGDTIKGGIDVGGQSAGTWSATRVEGASPQAGDRDRDRVDVTGAWLFTVTTDAGSGTPTMTFKQTGEKLTGRYSGQFGEFDLTGTVIATSIAFAFDATSDAGTLHVEYSGTVDGDSMKGKTRYGEMAEGTFTAKRKPAQ
jgi:hypothetical protein